MNLSNLSNDLKLKTNFNANSTFGLNDINGITGIVDNSTSSLQALIFSNKDAQNEDTDPTNYDLTGINSDLDNTTGFVFDLKKDYKFGLQSDITDHYVEDNVAIQDHVALKPITLEVTGVIAELDLKSGTAKTINENKIKKEIGQKDNIFNSVSSFTNRMGSLTQFAPNIVNQALNIYNSAKYAYNAASKFVNMIKKDNTQKKKVEQGVSEVDDSIIKTTKQFEYITWFKEQWRRRASFTIITPYGILNNMYIVSLSAVQPESSRYITNLTISFKEIRKAKVIKEKKQSAQTKETQDNKQDITLSLPNIDALQYATRDEYLGHFMTKTNIGTDVSNDLNTVIKSNSTATYNCSGSDKITSENINVNKESITYTLERK